MGWGGGKTHRATKRNFTKTKKLFCRAVGGGGGFRSVVFSGGLVAFSARLPSAHLPFRAAWFSAGSSGSRQRVRVSGGHSKRNRFNPGAVAFLCTIGRGTFPLFHKSFPHKFFAPSIFSGVVSLFKHNLLARACTRVGFGSGEVFTQKSRLVARGVRVSGGLVAFSARLCSCRVRLFSRSGRAWWVGGAGAVRRVWRSSILSAFTISGGLVTRFARLVRCGATVFARLVAIRAQSAFPRVARFYARFRASFQLG